jgi:hypothetical protein
MPVHRQRRRRIRNDGLFTRCAFDAVEISAPLGAEDGVPATTGRSAMVAAKEERKTAEAAWAAAAAASHYRCAICGTVPPYAERAIFFARDLCRWCADAVDRDDRAGTRST